MELLLSNTNDLNFFFNCVTECHESVSFSALKLAMYGFIGGCSHPRYALTLPLAFSLYTFLAQLQIHNAQPNYNGLLTILTFVISEGGQWGKHTQF